MGLERDLELLRDIISGVSQLVMSVNNAIEKTAYDLNAAAFSETTDITSDFILDNIELKFTTTAARNISITSSDGTIIFEEEDNIDKSLIIPGKNLGFNGGENITVDLSQTGATCLVDVRLRVRSGSNTLVGAPILGAGNATIGSIKQADDFFTEVALGNIPGYSFVHKFGNNEDVGAAREDIWDGGGDYIWPADGTAPVTHLYSMGADVQLIEVQGLDIDGSLTIQTKALTGTTVVALDTPLWRVFRLKNIGNIDIGNTVHASDAGKATSYAQIINGNNQTLMALYTIPAGKIGLMYHLSFSTNKDKDVTIEQFERPHGQVFQLKNHHHMFQDYFSFPYNIPKPITAKTDIVCRATDGASGAMVSSTFILLLVDI